MRKSLFVGGLVVLSCGLAASVYVAAPPKGRVRPEDDLARKRLQNLARQATGKPTENVRLLSLQLSIDQPASSAATIYHGHELIDNPKVGPLIKEFGRRLSWLQEIEGSKEHILVGASGGVSFPNPKSMVRFTMVQGVEAIQVKHSNGKPRYLAIRPSTPIMLISTIDPTSPRTSRQKSAPLTRADFVNPEDIDWFFGVRDFSNP